MATRERRPEPIARSRGAIQHHSTAAQAVEWADLGHTPFIAPATALGMTPPAQRSQPLDAASVLALQRLHGNAHVQRMIVQRGTAPIQRSISVAKAKQWIKQASSGAGTDEDKIYEAIRQCADRAALKADPEVQRYLKSEMKGHELWKAQLLLEYGKETAFPPTIRAIWGATEGAGTDEERIYKAIDKLKPGQLDEFMKLPGFKEILQADLNKGEMKRATGGAGILARHKKNVAFVKKVLTEMKAPGSPFLERNTAEWMAPTGGGAPKIELYVLTKTHDSAARATKQGKAGELAYFGKSQLYPDDSGDYDLNIASTRNIYYAEKAVAGEHQSKKIWLMEPKTRSSASVRADLVHEVQHDADKHELDPDWPKAYKSPEESWIRYRTEFRAYWIMGRFDDDSVTAGTATKAKFDNARQQAIFDFLWGDSEKDTYAEWLRPNYRGNTSVGGDKFQDLVHAYTHPEGVNLINSPRIDDVYNRLDRCKKTDTDLTKSPLKELKAAAQALNEVDRLYVNSSRAATLQQMMKDNLAANPLRQIATIVNGGTLPKWA